MKASITGPMLCATLAAALFASPLAAKPTPRPAAQPALRLERVVMLMRHGIRPPTKANPVPPGYSSETWPSWPVDFGLLTPRGAAGARLLGAGDRAYYARRGLFGPGCPAPGAVSLTASGKQRAIRTAESWAEGFMPRCAATVTHPVNEADDPIFHGLDDQPVTFDGARAWREALARAPRGGLAADFRTYRGDLALLARVLGCARPCPLLTEPSRLVAEVHDRPGLEGPVDVGSTASQSLLLEYLEGMPMRQVGWGRVSRAEIEQMLRFHPLKFKYSNRVPYVAATAAAPIANALVAGLDGTNGAKLTLLAGHDTNLADLGGLLDLHWKVPSYPADDVPPGSALGFELLRGAGGVHYVRAFYRAQTMDQLRYQQSLATGAGAFRQYLPIPGCGASTAERACTLARFKALVARRTAP